MTRNRFEAGAERYARFRPSYPPELAAHLAEAARRSVAASGSADDAELCALDVGCGTGQLTRGLAEHFTRVIGADPSADQLSRATAHPRITYVRAPAEALPAADASVHLVAAAQAAHWFDLDAFYSEVRRVAAPHAVLALVSYGVIETPPEFAPMFDRFYTEGIGPFWPPERRHVDAGYATLAFPFPELPMSDLAIVRDLARRLPRLRVDVDGGARRRRGRPGRRVRRLRRRPPCPLGRPGPQAHVPLAAPRAPRPGVSRSLREARVGARG